MNNREAFEAWAEVHSYYLDKDSEGKYVKNTTGMAWQIWRAAKKTPPLDFSKSQIGNYAAEEVIRAMWANGMESEAQSLADCFYGLVDANAALASQAQQDHIGDSNKLVKAINALAAQTGESPESITEWLTDKGGLTQLMLSHFGGMQSQAQQTTELSDKCKVAASCLTYNDAEKEAVAKHLLLEASQQLRRVQPQPTESQWISVEERLPENDHAVLALDEFNNHRVMWRTFVPNTDKRAWKDCSSWRILPDNEVTHWMPLPPAPEGGD